MAETSGITLDSKKLLETEDQFSKAEHRTFKDILHRYYRQSLPFELEAYRNFSEQPVEARMAMKNDPFWTSIGKYVHVLDFSDQEKIKFARETEIQHLVVFLLFEKDLTVLEEVFSNPRLPTKVLLDYVNLIKERDIDREDDKILKTAQKVMKRRSRRILKVRDLHRASEDLTKSDHVLTAISYLIDDDPQVRMAAENAVSALSADRMKETLEEEMLISQLRQHGSNFTAIDIMEMLQTAVKIVLRAEALSQNLEESAKPASRRTDLYKAMHECKLRELEKCKEDPTDLFNVTLLTSLQYDSKQELRTRAREILQPDDIMDLIADESTPRPIVMQVLALMEKSEDEPIRQKTRDIRLKEAERVNRKMKEIEVSVNAYFDVIFQSLGYSRINTQKEAVTALRNSIGFLQQYAKEADHLEQGSLAIAQGFVRHAIEHFEHAINDLYGDTKKELFMELDQIQGMVNHILDLKSFKFDDDAPTAAPMDEAVLNKAVMIWRNAISQFLGRIKDLEEMLRLKWNKLAIEAEKHRKVEDIESDLYEAFSEIESMHKENVECKLKIPCRECKRRGCASERFMHQIDFLIGEISENFNQAASSHHA